MAEMETIALGRSRRSTAGNRMRELLEKAHQEDDDDLFKEVEDDEDFEAPQEQRDVFLDEFADTDDEVEMDEEEVERQMRREERRKAKGKSKAIYDPTLSYSRTAHTSTSTNQASLASAAATLVALDPSLDVSNMAPTTLVLTLRKQRREAKRLERSETRRSNLRATTLKTEEEILAKEISEKAALANSRKGRKALHEGGEARGVRNFTQDELIANALEEEERNKDALKAWLRREEERRELRRVGRKRVVGPRWTWVSRTVGRAVEVLPDKVEGDHNPEISKAISRDGQVPIPVDKADTDVTTETNVRIDANAAVLPIVTAAGPSSQPDGMLLENSDNPQSHTDIPVHATPTTAPNTSNTDDAGDINMDFPLLSTETAPNGTPLLPKNGESSQITTPQPSIINSPTPLPPPSTTPSTQTPQQPQLPPPAIPTAQPTTAEPPITTTTTTEEALLQAYTRNYLILSEIPGGLPSELQLILGNHTEWDKIQYIPSRNRPIKKRPVLCPFTGLPARYRHPITGVPYADVRGFREIEALLGERYIWNGEKSVWLGGEEDIFAEGVESEVPGWREAVMGGWVGGKRIVDDDDEEEVEVEEGGVVGEEALVDGAEEGGDVSMVEVDEVQVIDAAKKKGKSKDKDKGKGSKRKSLAGSVAVEEEVADSVEEATPKRKKAKSKSKGKK